MRHLASLVFAASALALPGAHAASWRIVPGASELEVDITSVQHERQKATAWLRWWGRPAIAALPDAAPRGRGQPRVHRTALQVEFDCAQRRFRTVAATAYDGGGTAVSMSSDPGPVLPVHGDELAWAYDAVCEMARAGGRF